MSRRVPPPPTGLAALAALVVTGAVLTGCGGGRSPAPEASGPPSAARTATGSASPSPRASGFTTSCEDALPVTAVDQAAGQPIIGLTSFVVGRPDPGIGRVAYLNCRYGLPDPSTVSPPAPSPTATGDPVPLLEIGVSLYSSPDRAAARVTSTVEDYSASGSTPSTVRVGTVPATVLTGGGPTTLVAADGPRTVAVSADPSIVTGTDMLVRLAALALTNVR